MALARARAVHGDRYDYSQATYTSSVTPLTIICSQHGPFEQTPTNHTRIGCGCPSCGRERSTAAHARDWAEQAQGRTAILYFVHLTGQDESFYKVGITYHSVAERYRKLHQHGYSYEILAQHTSTDAARIYDWEQSILHTFAHLRYHPKRNFGGASECFTSADEILQIFPL